jgi:RNA polymerase sigma factor (sigma-70 family)
MHESSSPTAWLRQLRDGDTVGAQKLWEAYYRKLISLARRKLEGRARLVGDEEDVTLSAFKSFCRGVQEGRYPQLNDRNDLWRMLVRMTLNKAAHLVRDEGRLKRGGNRKAGSGAGDDAALDQLVSDEPTPELAAELAEQCELLLGQLPTEEFVSLALLKMEGYTNAEIAANWGKAERTVERKLQIIRQIWSKAAE